MDHACEHANVRDAQQVTTLLTEAQAAVRAAHQATGYPCTPCAACRAVQDTSFLVWPVLDRSRRCL